MSWRSKAQLAFWMILSCGVAVSMALGLDLVYGSAKASPEWVKLIAVILVGIPTAYTTALILEEFSSNKK